MDVDRVFSVILYSVLCCVCGFLFILKYNYIIYLLIPHILTPQKIIYKYISPHLSYLPFHTIISTLKLIT